MAISVEGYGNITQANAKEIYVAWKRGEVQLDPSQQKKCESFLTPEEMDEVQYDTEVTKNRGKNSIDTSDAKDNGNATEGASTGASVGAAAGSITAVVVSLTGGAKASKTNGFLALAAAIVGLVSSAAALVLSYAFDNQLKDRKNHSQNAGNDNQTLDGYSDNLANTMDMMNEDVQTYNDQQNNLTKTVNTQTSQMADLQMQYDAAVAMGDTQGAQKIKEQMLALKKQDNSGLEDELAETAGAIEEYRAMNAESMGSAESGQTVSDFLKDGKLKGALATTNGVLCLVTSIIAAVTTAVAAIPKIWAGFIPVDGPAGISAALMWGAIGAMMGLASNNYFKKASDENECGDNGDEMQDHVNNLNEMIAQQDAYTTETEGAFEKSDEAAEESKGKAAEEAGKAVSGNKETVGNKPNNNGNDNGGKKEEKPVPVA